jgi:hypothetical protein
MKWFRSPAARRQGPNPQRVIRRFVRVLARLAPASAEKA